MATIAQLTERSPGKFTQAFLPFLQALRATEDPYMINEAAFILKEYQDAWGGGNPKGEDNFFVRSRQVKYTSFPWLRNASETALLANFRLKLATMDMSQSNSIVEFYKFVELFYKIVDPFTWFLTDDEEHAFLQFECPPDPPGCPPYMNFFTSRIGGYRRPQVDGEGTGFYFENPQIGDAQTKQIVNVGFVAPLIPCNPPEPPCIPVAALNNRYFVMNVDGATGEDDIIWYDYEGTGQQPVVVGNGGPQNFIPVAIDRNDEWNLIQQKTDAAVVGGGNWILAPAGAICYDMPPPAPPAKVVKCPFKYTSAYEAATVGPRIDTVDGRNGFSTPQTVMYASDASMVADELDTDQQWQDAHNKQRVPYEASLGNRIKYLLAVEDLPCYPPPPPCSPVDGLFIQTPILGVINDLPINAPGVINDATAGITRTAVVD